MGVGRGKQGRGNYSKVKQFLGEKLQLYIPFKIIFVKTYMYVYKLSNVVIRVQLSVFLSTEDILYSERNQ